MESGELVFNQTLFDEEMKKSGLLNSLSNPIFPIEAQFCFIHLTIQEFLAALHVIETHAPPEIQMFILEHVKSGEWHLVLQFIAGLLGTKIMFDKEYKDCVWAFAESLKVTRGKIELDSDVVGVMKYLREVDDNKIIKEVCEATALNDVVKLHNGLYHVSPSDWAAVSYILKHMTNLANLVLSHNAMDDEDVIMLFEDALTKEHCKLTVLDLCDCSLTDECIPSLCEALQDERCQLTDLTLSLNDISDDGACMLFEDALTKEHCKLTELNLSECLLTHRCIPSLCKTLQDEHCQLTDLSLGFNIGDEGACMLFEDALTKEHCKLTKLNLSECLLTDLCIPSLCKTLQDEHCQLTDLSLGFNAIGDEGACMLFEDALTKEHCKLTVLDLRGCLLTDQCILSLCKELQDERCKLTKLWLRSKNFTENGWKILRHITNYKSCKARGLQIEEPMDQGEFYNINNSTAVIFPLLSS
jgi:hypothetical protein